MNALDVGALLDALRGAEWPARAAAPVGAAGTHRSRQRGLSAEFTEYRPYRQGDDPHRLDWKLLARTDRAYLRLASERSVLGTVVIVDASASMAFPEPAHDKWRTAALVALGLAAVAHAAGDPVGLVVSTAREAVRTRPRTRRGVLAELARVLAAVRPAGSAPLAPALAGALRVPRVAVVSDFLGDEGRALRAARALLAAGAEVHAVEVVAREELEPAGAFLAVDPEEPAMRRPFAPEALPGYRARFDAWRTASARDWRRAGASFTEVRTDEPAAHAVRRVLAAGEPLARAAP